MTATFIVQDDQGDVVGANAYITVQQFQDYHDSRGQTYIDPTTGANYVDTIIQMAIVRATDYIDGRFNFIGWRRYSNQPTAWPRWDAVDINDRYLKGIPQGVSDATCEYAMRALTQAQLVADPTYDESGRNLHQQIEKIGPIDLTKVFEGGFVMPKYPSADRKLYQWGLVVSGGKMVRS